jgi:drug/metabolite transporter (DMT)-like permease
MCSKTTAETITGNPILALAVMTTIWGYNWVVMKEALRFCDPFVFSAIRVFPAAICLFGILLWTKKDWRPRQVKWTVILGLLSTTLGLGLPIWSLVSGGAGKTAILLYTMPFWVILLAWPILGERINGFEWLAVILAFAGLALIVAVDAVGAKLFSSILAVISGIAWADNEAEPGLRRCIGHDLANDLRRRAPHTCCVLSARISHPVDHCIHCRLDL